MQRHHGVREKDNSHPFLFDNVDSLHSDCGPYHPPKPVETLLQLSFHSNSEKTVSAGGKHAQQIWSMAYKWAL